MLAISLVASPLCAPAAEAQESTIACPNPVLGSRAPTPLRSGKPILLDTRQFDAAAGRAAEAKGDVELRRADQYFATDLLRYDPEKKEVFIPGPLVYEDIHLRVEAKKARYALIDEAGEFSAVEFSLSGAGGRGSASEIIVDTSEHSRLAGLEFTTCAESDPAWLLSARDVEFRHDEGIGIARGAKLEFMDIPILYLPWMSFPIDDRRKSGFLYPRASSANDNGFEMGIPYYWNIAPDKDATLTPRVFSDRGAMLTGEYRMLTRRTHGRLDFDFMPNDERTGKERYHYRLRHGSAINPHWHSNVLLDRVSDDRYFQDFGLSLAQTARQYLRSSAGINGSGRYWTFSILADDFQVIDESVSEFSEPYRRLPRVAYMLERPVGPHGLQFALDSEAVHFDRDVGVTGARLDLYPRLSWGLNRYWGFLRSSAGYRYTAYDLDLQDGDPSPDRGTGIFSFDAGLFFERMRDNGELQTLEPRVFYLYVPYRDQQHLPDFDTREFTFGFSQLFHTNRFTGADRQMDANQLTLALTTRSMNPKSGRERWSLSVGQIFYFDDKRVSLQDDMMEGLDTSPLVAEIEWRPLERFTGRLGLQWNWEETDLDMGTVGIDYRSGSGSRVGFEYRYRRDRIDQFDIRHYWPVNSSWTLLSRLKYSLADHDLLEAQAGAEYESCCWGVRIIGRRYLRSRLGDERDAIYVELRLKGLGSFGRETVPLFYDQAE